MAFQPGSNAVLERSFSRSEAGRSDLYLYVPAIVLLVLGGPSLALWMTPYMPWLFWSSLGVLGGALLTFLLVRNPRALTLLAGVLAVISATIFLGCFNARYNTPLFSIVFLSLAVLALILAISFHIVHIVNRRKTTSEAFEQQLPLSDNGSNEQKEWNHNAV